MLDLVSAQTWHMRLGDLANRFRYRVDYVLTDAETPISVPALFSRNRPNLMSLFDRDHGGDRGKGRGAGWVRDVLDQHGANLSGTRILLLAQPRIFGTRFSPVSFWLVVNEHEELIAAIAEVNNTFGERHSYLCMHDDLRPIRPNDIMETSKVFHVSPFQPLEGAYRFNFELTSHSVSVRIDYRAGKGGLIATLKGPRKKLKSSDIILIYLRRPFGSLRVLGLIHFQAAKLWLKRAPFRSKPPLVAQEVSR